MSARKIAVGVLCGVILVAALGWTLYAVIAPTRIEFTGCSVKLVYAVDTTGVPPEELDGAMEDLVARITRRLDPDGFRNIVCARVGADRVEIVMPFPKTEGREQKRAVDRLIAEISLTNVRREQIEFALRAEAGGRDAELDKLAKGIAARADALRKCAQAYDALRTAEEVNAGITVAREEYGERAAEVLGTNVPLGQLWDILELQDPAGIDDFKTRNEDGGRPDLIARLSDAYDEWRRHRGPLDDGWDPTQLLQGRGALDFRILPARAPGLSATFDGYKKQLKETGPRPQANAPYRWIRVADPKSFNPGGSITGRDAGGATYVLAHTDVVPGLTMLHDQSRRWRVAKARLGRDPQTGKPEVDFVLDDAGADLFRQLTGTNVNEPLCIILDGEALTAPIIQSTIGRRARIAGRFSLRRAQEIAAKLNAGAFPVPLIHPPISVEFVGPAGTCPGSFGG